MEFLHYSFAGSGEEGRLFVQLAFMGQLAAIGALLGFVRSHVTRPLLLTSRSWVTATFVGVFLIAVLGATTDTLIAGAQLGHHGKYVAVPGAYYSWLVVPFVGIVCALSLAELVNECRTRREGKFRAQTSVLLMGFALFAGGLLGTHVLPVALQDPYVPDLAIPLTALNVVLIGAAMLRLNLFTITPERSARAIVNYMGEGLLLLDHGGRIAYANPAAQSLTGYRQAELMGRSLETLLRPALRVREFVARGHRGERLEGDGEVWTESGGTTSVEFTICGAGTGTPEGSLVCVLRDVGKLKAMVNQLEAISEVLEKQASTDSLTGAVNRRRLDKELERWVFAAQRRGRPLSLVMFDLDRFKAINDEHGHDKGDAVLQAVVKRAERVLRSNDVLGRFGGDEFLLLLPDTDAEAARGVAERLLQSFRSLGDGLGVGISASFGVVTYTGAFPMTHGADLVYQVDQALLRAKGGGRDRIEIAPLGAPERHPRLHLI